MGKLSLSQRALLKMGNVLGVSNRVALTRELSRHWMPLGKRVVVSLDEHPRRTEDGVDVLPARVFAQRLWGGKLTTV
jgi:hypothetical protein